MVLQLIIIQIVTFVAVVFVLRKLLYTEAAKEVLRLKQLKEEFFGKEKELREKIVACDTAYKKKMDEAEADINALRLRAKDEIEAERDKARSIAKAEAEAIINSALNTREKMREEISVEMRKKAPEIAATLFVSVLSDETKKIVHRELTAEVARKIKSVERLTFESGTAAVEAEVRSAYPLSKEEASAIETALSGKSGRQVHLAVKEAPELAAGVVIKIGGVIIDGSLADRLETLGKEYA